MTSTELFYDDLAATYDLIYSDWEESIARQAAALDNVIRRRLGDASLRGLDCACGIGTQLIGLAALGYRMHGTDLSGRAVDRAISECDARGLAVEIRRADMRELPHHDASFDVVLCADNSLPHLLTDDDVIQALREMRRVGREGALVVISTRDYDAILNERPAATPVQRHNSGQLRSVTTQLWDWHPDGVIYDLTHLQVHETHPSRWVAAGRAATYRAWTRAELSTLAERAGLNRVAWAGPADTGFFQPLMLADV